MTTTTRHQFYYEWIYFGWSKLDPSYPLHKNRNEDSSNNITNWIHKSTTHQEYLREDLYTFVNNYYVFSITLEKLINDGETTWHIIVHDEEEGREFGNYVNYNVPDKNNLEFADRHWLYAENWHGHGHGKLNRLMDPRLQYQHDDGHMPNLTSQGAREFEPKLDDHCDRVTNYLSNQRKKVIQYFKHEPLCDMNQQWSVLDIQYFEEYSSTDIFYVPFRRRVTPDWL